ncbi:MAG: pilus assembly protein CpaC [Psychromonas sp.]|jgi:pilus assembly protein CpaC
MNVYYKLNSHLLLLLFSCLFVSLRAFAGLDYIEDANGKKLANHRDFIQWTHSRLVFSEEIKRVAVGQDKTLEVEIIGTKELLILAKQVGKTSMIVWYEGGRTETFLFSVTEDLSVLRSALTDIHPAIRLELAPDRPALILRGTVPSIDYKIAAEAAARHYLGASQKNKPGKTGNNSAQVFSDALDMITANQNTSTNDIFRLNASQLLGQSQAAIINLIKLKIMPRTLEEKVEDAISNYHQGTVTVTRIVKGDIANNQEDILLLDGDVADQVALTRILNIAARLFVGSDNRGEITITAVTDEGGGILSQLGASNTGSSLFGKSTTGKKGNDIRSNIARSKLLSMADGRILSTIKVKDLPKIRVAVQIHEVNRNRMLRWRPDFSLKTNGYSEDGLFGLGGLSEQSEGANSIENALQLLGGSLTNNLQFTSNAMAFDLLFSLMEQEGISKSLSRPTITVLTGETAVFNVGGEVPIPTAFAPTGIKSGDEIGSNTAGVFSGTTFKSFGVSLSLRAVVDEDDRITLDINPSISAPDTLLTQQISGSTGSKLNSSAFNVRSINTTAQLKDGQPLVLAGLVYSEHSSSDNFTPGLNSVPVLGKLAQQYNDTEQERELVIIVTPTLVRESRGDVHLWSFPSTFELAASALMPVAKQPYVSITAED